ncbi:uncharacterized protein [Nothobranchius furzeri]
MAEEPEDARDSSHPSVISLTDALPLSQAVNHSCASSYITVHYSMLPSPDQVQIHSLPPGGGRSSKDSPKVVYTLLPQPRH